MGDTCEVEVIAAANLLENGRDQRGREELMTTQILSSERYEQGMKYLFGGRTNCNTLMNLFYVLSFPQWQKWSSL